MLASSPPTLLRRILTRNLGLRMKWQRHISYVKRMTLKTHPFINLPLHLSHHQLKALLTMVGLYYHPLYNRLHLVILIP
jgi:hypothetical protein